MAPKEFDPVDRREFTADERAQLRRMMRADDRARWFWMTARSWVYIVGAVATAVTAVKLGLGDVIKWLRAPGT